jgi:4,5-dihydroxyphthalate decarboxylase
VSRAQVTLAFSRSARIRPLLDGEVEVEGVDLVPCVISPGDLFWRQLHFAEFDVSELSTSGLLMMKSNGTAAFSALPAFPSRAFFHTNILVRAGAGIERPADLKGKRVGVAEYQQTAAVWTRGALAHEFGVTPDQIEWHMGRSPERSHGSSTGFRPPAGVQLHYVAEGQNLGRMLLGGQIDAIIAYAARNGGLGLGQEDEQHPGRRSDGYVDREDIDVSEAPEVHNLFPDVRGEGQRYYEATGIFPFNHVVAVRDSLTERHPWLARNLYDAFCRARDLAYRRMCIQLEPYEALGAVQLSEIAEADRAQPYGVAANRRTLDALLEFALEQGLVGDHLRVEDVFAPTVSSL